MVLRLTATHPEGLASPSATGLQRPPNLSRLQVHALIAAASFGSYILGKALPGDGFWPMLFAMGGVGSCGWSWLLTRALFDPAEHDARWPRIVAVMIWLTGILSIALGAEGGVGSAADNAYALTGSAALLITFVEPLQGFRRSLPRRETVFRVAFLATYGVLVTVSILLVRETAAVNPVGPDPDVLRGVCAVVGLAAAGGAVWFRLRHPLVTEDARLRPATPDDRRLAERILQVVREQALYVAPDLKVADLAGRLGEPEYRVTRSITAASGFANFNRLINHHRIARAKRMLDDPTLRTRPVLLIAFDCGFASVGPFNRAFKAETGVTPREWRRRTTAPV